MKRRILAAMAGSAIFIAAGVAAAGSFASSAQTDFYSSGEHEFYVWCPGSANYMATESGRNAEDAQLRLYDASKAAGRSDCWPIWQGR
ncbi:MAG TPA: hypothetical protein VIY09_02305, partial [Rhizomicrobium sp.]